MLDGSAGTTRDILLAARDVSKSFGAVRVLHEVSFDVHRGEVLGILGPNGAGKTTFFNLITGHLKPNSGEVLYESQSITQLPPHNIVRRGIARSFQRINIYPRMTVFQNIQVSVIARNKKHFSFFRPASNFYKKETQELLELVTLSEEQHGIAGELSYGKQKQLELAISLASNPKVLLLLFLN
mgnify:CR=1 FL=1